MNGNDEKLITLIVPVYNTDLVLLERLFDSIKNQSCKKFDLIFVDDCSEKKVSNWLDNIDEVSINIKIIHKNKNTGPSDTRNCGIRETYTKYICFSDSDDVLSLDFIEKCYAYIKNYDADLYCFNIEYVPRWDTNILIDDTYYFDDEENITELKKSIFEIKNRKYKFNVNVSACAKVYLTDIVKKVMFDDRIFVSEDQLFITKYVNNIHSFLLVPDVVYTYFQNKVSLTHNYIKNIGFETYRPFFDEMQRIFDSEKCIDSQDLYEFELRMLNGFTNRVCASNFFISLKESYSKMLDAIRHPMISNMIKDVNIFKIKTSLLNKINIIFLKLKLYYLYLFEKRMIYVLHLNKDKI